MGVTGTGSCDLIQSEVKMARYVARRSAKHFVYDGTYTHFTVF